MQISSMKKFVKMLMFILIVGVFIIMLVHLVHLKRSKEAKVNREDPVLEEVLELAVKATDKAVKRYEQSYRKELLVVQFPDAITSDDLKLGMAEYFIVSAFKQSSLYRKDCPIKDIVFIDSKWHVVGSIKVND